MTPRPRPVKGAPFSVHPSVAWIAGLVLAILLLRPSAFTEAGPGVQVLVGFLAGLPLLLAIVERFSRIDLRLADGSSARFDADPPVG